MSEEDFNAFLLRVLRIILSIVLSAVIANILVLFLWADPVPPDTFAFGPHLLWFAFLLFLFWPAYFAGLAFVAADRLAFRFPVLRWLFLLWPVGAATGVLLAGAYRPDIGVYFLFLLVYWLLTGRIAGRRGWSPKNLRGAAWDERLYPFVVVSLLVIALVTSFTPVPEPASRRRVEISANYLGTPPMQLQHEWEQTEAMADALRRFPDPQSCLQDGAEASERDDLVRIDWDRIRTTDEARVCVFRLMHEFGGIDGAKVWLEAQGFRARPIAVSTNPYANPEGYQTVSGGWSVRENGRRFGRQIVRPVPSLEPYGMNVNLTYTADGRELLFVNIGFSIL